MPSERDDPQPTAAEARPALVRWVVVATVGMVLLAVGGVLAAKWSPLSAQALTGCR